jgi:uncharacterized protein
MNMEMLNVTLTLLAVFGLLGVMLGIQVILRRVRLGVEAGDGGVPRMAQAVRAHGNFAEYVPLALLLLGAVEWLGYSNIIVGSVAVALVAGRLLSAFGLSRSLGPSIPRQAGASVTLLAMLISSGLIAVALINQS